MDVPNSDQSTNLHAAGQNDRGKKAFRIPSPPVDWDLNQLLINIGQEMNMEDLEAAKMMFKGQEGLGRKVLSETKTPLELFDSLQKHCFIDRDNLLYLQGMLYRIRRIDLFEKVADYATRRLNDAVHYKSPDKEPANGFMYVQFHVKGKNLDESSLQDLRAKAAKIMGVPQQFIIIAGTEPSASLLITLMIPEGFGKYLESALGRSESLKELESIQVNIVLIGQRQWKVNGSVADDILLGKKEQQFSAMYRKLHDTEDKLDESEKECLKLKRQVKVQETNNEGLSDQTKAFLVEKLYKAYCNRNVHTLSKQSALSFYRFCLKQLEKLVIHTEVKELIFNLLDAYGLVIKTRLQDTESIWPLRLMSEIKELQDRAYQLEILKARKLFENKTTAFEKTTAAFLEKRAAAALQSRFKVQQKIQFDPSITLILKEISDLLTEAEKRQLHDKYVWPKDESLTKQMQHKDNPFLAGLTCKEIEATGSGVALGEFIPRTLKEVNREDLVKKFVESVEKAQTQTAPAVLKNIQDQMGLVLQKLENLENNMGKGVLSYRPNINVGPLQADVLNLHMGPERIQELGAELANRKEFFDLTVDA